jgi:hypothetical protein
MSFLLRIYFPPVISLITGNRNIWRQGSFNVAEIQALVGTLQSYRMTDKRWLYSNSVAVPSIILAAIDYRAAVLDDLCSIVNLFMLRARSQ